MLQFSYGQEVEIAYWDRVPTDTTRLASLPLSIQKSVAKGAEGEYYTLFINNGLSLYEPKIKRASSLKNSSTKTDEFGNKETISGTVHTYSERIFIDKSANESQSSIQIFGLIYNIKEDAKGPEWEIKDTYKIIDKYDCQLAITSMYGQEIKAWFVKDIPLNYGPSFFYNLPGLVIQVEMGTKVITATHIQYKSDKTIEATQTGISISRESYDNMIMDKFFNVKESVEVTKEGNKTIRKGVTKY